MTSQADCHKLWADFLEAWPPERVRQMTLKEYTNPGKDDAFIYWIESRLEQLGSIWGGSAFKFGIYYQANVKTKETSGGRNWGEQYAWLSKYGSSEHEAFRTIRGRLVEVMEAARAGNIARVDEIDLSPTLKWKVAFLYQDKQKPVLFPIFKKEALFQHYLGIVPNARIGSTPYHVMYETLLERHSDIGDVFAISLALWERFQADRERGPRAWAVPLSGSVDTEAIEALCKQDRVEPEDIDAFLENMLSAVELSEGDLLALLVGGDVRALGRVTSAEPGQHAWDQTPVSFPSTLVVNPTSEIRELDASEHQEIWSHLPTPEPDARPAGGGQHRNTAPAVEAPLPPCEPRNVILYGPPGTGKTYSTVRRALELILGRAKLEGLTEKGLMALFRDHQARGQIEFVTFHQAYGYEEFVEGIRPVLGRGAAAEVRYELHDGVFKRIALRAAAEGLRVEATQPEFDELWDMLLSELGEEDGRVAKSQSGKTYRLEMNARGNILVRGCEVDNDGNVTQLAETPQIASKEDTRLCWKHRAELGLDPGKFTYEKTTALFAREKGGSGGNHYTALWLAYSELFALSRAANARKIDAIDRISRVQQAIDKPGPTTTFSFSARSRQHVLIIDEINRGNMSKILGELITLLEPDKRMTARNELKLPLSYSPQHRFAVPPNLHVLGTMNTADRSIALMDVALRRRFTFEELMPDAAVIREALRERAAAEPFIELVVDIFETLNHRIRFLYDRDHQLGHSYFLEAVDPEALRVVFLDRIIPMLQEYFYGAWDKICIVLGCPYNEVGEPKRSGSHLIESSSPKSYIRPLVAAGAFPEVGTLGFDHDDYEDRVDYHVLPSFQQGVLGASDLFGSYLAILALDPDTHGQRLKKLLASSQSTA